MIPEGHFNQIVIEGTNYMQIKRQFSIELNDECLFLKYQVNRLSDDSLDYFTCNMDNYHINTIPDIITKYAIINESTIVVPDEEMKGYLFTCTLNQEVNNSVLLRNMSSYTKINNGSRIIYLPEEYKLCNLNESNTEDAYQYFYTTNKITGIINVRITKNINYLSTDNEFFKSVDYKNAEKKNYITKYGYARNYAI